MPRRRAKRRGRVALAPAQLAQVLQKTAAGENLTEAALLADVRDGAPADRRGRLDLIRYLAWLLRQHGYGGTKP